MRKLRQFWSRFKFYLEEVLTLVAALVVLPIAAIVVICMLPLRKHYLNQSLKLSACR